ncbi:MAG: thioredoxin family protein [Anaerolineaceae bacterium]|nr:thioredoxin family protein [Anaerolineaceae bacterium]
MLERVLILAIIAAVGFTAYPVLRRYHVSRVATNAKRDPLLSGLKPGIPAIVYFTTPGCMPCKTQQQPALATLQTELGDGIQIIQVDAADDPEAARRWGVFSAPTTFILDGQGKPQTVNHGVAGTVMLRQQLAGLAGQPVQ